MIKAKYTIWILPTILGIVWFVSRPFPQTLASTSVSLNRLSYPQKSNIEVASHALDGYVVRPGEEFSFNRIVGERTINRGYRPAPSYLGPDSPKTEGGGICLVSSVLYQTALKSDLAISQRVPHLRPIKSVAPGLDATVWYGGADLRFQNNSPEPIEIKTSYNPDELTISILGKSTSLQTISLQTRSVRANPNQMLVEVYCSKGDKQKLVTKDIYWSRGN